jgi:hypothetical protein
MWEHPVKDTPGRTKGYFYEAFKDDLCARPIRLLRLFPAASLDEDIKCELFHTTLDAKNRVGFEALSYTWGDPNSTSPITRHGKPHHITKNLDVALRHLRYPERERTLWADALCIYSYRTAMKNYDIRFSGPVTALTTRRVRYGHRTRTHLPARFFARYKDVLVPRRFSNNSLPLFCSLPPSHLPAPPLRASGRAELHLLPCQAP